MKVKKFRPSVRLGHSPNWKFKEKLPVGEQSLDLSLPTQKKKDVSRYQTVNI